MIKSTTIQYKPKLSNALCDRIASLYQTIYDEKEMVNAVLSAHALYSKAEI